MGDIANYAIGMVENNVRTCHCFPTLSHEMTNQRIEYCQNIVDTIYQGAPEADQFPDVPTISRPFSQT